MLDEFWKREFGSTPKLAHILCAQFARRRVRFHSFPNGQRYAHDKTELCSALNRHNTLLSALAKPRANLLVLTTNYSAELSTAKPDELVLDTGLYAELWCSVPMHEIESEMEPNYWHLFRSVIEWRPHVVDDLLRLVAGDQIRNVMLLDPAKSWLYHPYDGGSDVIHESPLDRDILAKSFEEWLSPNPDGL